MNPDFPKLTVANVAKAAPIIAPLIAKVLAYRAIEQALRPKVVAIQTAILEAGDFKHEETGERITDPKLYWLIDDGQSEIYYDFCHRELVAAGLKAADSMRDICPLLVAENTRMDAERELIKTFANHFGMPVPINWELRNRMLALAMKTPIG